MGRCSFARLRFDVGGHSPLRMRCKAWGCTIHDALVTTLMLASRRLIPRGNVGVLYTINGRRFLPDTRPRVANLRGMPLLDLAPAGIGDSAATATRVPSLIGRQKGRFPGFPVVLSNVAAMSLVPHAVLRAGIGWWLRGGLAVPGRGQRVTHSGPMDSYLEPLGDRVLHAEMLGPWRVGLRVPIIVATGFRDRLTVAIHGFSAESVAFMRDVVARVIASEWVGAGTTKESQMPQGRADHGRSSSTFVSAGREV